MTRDDRRRWRLPFAIVLLIAACSHNHPAGTSMGARALASLTPIEKSVLKDKKVTVAEVMRSTRTYIECLDAHGLSHGVEDPSDLTTSGVSVEFGAPPGTADPDAYAHTVDAQIHACHDEVDAIDDVWVLQHEASQADLDRAEKHFVSCVRSAGLAIPATATPAEAGAAAKKLMQDTASTEDDPSSALGRETKQVSDCLETISKSTGVALPGLAEALRSLDTSGW
jgi:hypothetical protein